jgi:hypothetical protein
MGHWSAAVLVVALSATLAAGQNDAGAVSNAVLEGIQISSEPGTEAGEKVVSCYFIFRDKPSSYFYEVKKSEKKLVFEFNDVKKGASPIASMAESPIGGFAVDEKRVDINKDVRGLNPEWHNVTVVTFTLEAIPIITVNEEYSVVSYSFKWGTDPSKMQKYVEKDNKKKWVWIGTLGGIGAAAAAGVVIAVLAGGGGGGGGPQALSTGDLPRHGQ